ncbi:dapper homolog 3-like [Mustela lutreola]|uniref:dapper homolog 3-like n=1 Tax=Mustela lutreola TaxID=9666 RepID=UPI002797C74B|nr:dapper homolog 3-like [Mustela lutreola]
MRRKRLPRGLEVLCPPYSRGGKQRPRRDSNPQSSDPESDALSIRPRGQPAGRLLSSENQEDVARWEGVLPRPARACRSSRAPRPRLAPPTAEPRSLRSPPGRTVEPGAREDAPRSHRPRGAGGAREDAQLSLGAREDAQSSPEPARTHRGATDPAEPAEPARTHSRARSPRGRTVDPGARETHSRARSPRGRTTEPRGPRSPQDAQRSLGARRTHSSASGRGGRLPEGSTPEALNDAWRSGAELSNKKLFQAGVPQL